MTAPTKNGVPNTVSFSGMDGAGKSTQIDDLRTHVMEKGLHVLVVRFWDDIAKLTRFREAAGSALFKGDHGVGTPSAPIIRRDKNVKSPLMTVVRLVVYFIDAISVRYAVKKAMQSNVDLVIYDRYIYDELANLPLSNPLIRLYVVLIMKLVPKPHISYLLDADPVKALARKPEYPLEFLYSCRRSYQDLSDLIGGFIIISPMSIEDVGRSILSHIRIKLSFRTPQQKSNDCIDQDINNIQQITPVNT